MNKGTQGQVLFFAKRGSIRVESARAITIPSLVPIRKIVSQQPRRVATMSTLLTTLEQQALTLPSGERARLAEVLLESLHDSPLGELEAEWEREIERRVAEIESGSAQLIPIAEVLAQARAMLKQGHSD